MFQTLQSRLILELKLAGITSIQEANKFLENYIKKFNQQFAVQLHYTKSVYDTQLTSEKINYTVYVNIKLGQIDILKLGHFLPVQPFFCNP